MRLLATHVVPHPSGDKAISLYHGDLSRIPEHEHVDALVVSALPNDYLPTPSSLIGALHRQGISVLALSQSKHVDLRTTFSSWLSRDLASVYPSAGFRRLLCFETGRVAPPWETVGDIFRAITPFVLGEPPIRSIAMPVLAAGDQGVDPTVMLTAIFEASANWLSAGLPISVVKLAVFDAHSVEPLRDAFKTLSAQFSASPPASARQRQCSSARPYDLFVSYAHEDHADVDGLVAALKASAPSLRIFQDRLEVSAGQSWQAEIDSALESCTQVVAVYSPAYLASKMCVEEFNMARLRHRESQDPVLKPIYLRTAELPLYMRTLHYIDCREADRELIRAAAIRLGDA